MVQLTGMQLVQREDGSLELLHDRLAGPLSVPREQLERWLIRLVRQSLLPVQLAGATERAPVETAS